MKRVEIPLIKNEERNDGKSKLNNSVLDKSIFETVSIDELYDKFNNQQEFSRQDLISLYDIYHTRPVLTTEEEGLVVLILSHRIKIQKYDIAKIFNCKIDEITYSNKDLLQSPDKYVVLLDNLDFSISQHYPKLKYVKGSVTFYGTKLEQNNLPSLEVIGGHAYFDKVTTSKYLDNLKVICGHAYFGELTDATFLKNLTYIGWNADFKWLTNSDGLNNLTHIGGIADFRNLTETNNLYHLTYIGKNAYFNKINDTYGLQSLLYLGGESFFNPSINKTSLEALRVRLNTDIYHRKKVK